jgi:guanylate kinase
LNNLFTRQGIIFAVSAPSGTGKSTLCSNLRTTPDFVFSVSCTTRAARLGEIDGEDYFFLQEADFEAKIRQGYFLEFAKVHTCYYGTPKDQVLRLIGEGKDVLLDIDVHGVRQIRACGDERIQEALVDVFIMPPTMEELEKRLRKRGTETEEQIRIRLETAGREMPSWKEYKYTILSESMEEDLAKFRAIMKAERYASRRLSFEGKL